MSSDKVAMSPDKVALASRKVAMRTGRRGLAAGDGQLFSSRPATAFDKGAIFNGFSL
jgi:hypothetical protein